MRGHWEVMKLGDELKQKDFLGSFLLSTILSITSFGLYYSLPWAKLGSFEFGLIGKILLEPPMRLAGYGALNPVIPTMISIFIWTVCFFVIIKISKRIINQFIQKDSPWKLLKYLVPIIFIIFAVISLLITTSSIASSSTSCKDCSVDLIAENSNVSLFKISPIEENNFEECSEIKRFIQNSLNEYSFTCSKEGFFQSTLTDQRRKVTLPAEGAFEENYFEVTISPTQSEYAIQSPQTKKGDIFVIVLEIPKEEFSARADIQFGDIFMLSPVSEKLGVQKFRYFEPGIFIIFYPIQEELTEEYYYILYHDFEKLHIKETGFLKK